MLSINAFHFKYKTLLFHSKVAQTGLKIDTECYIIGSTLNYVSIGEKLLKRNKLNNGNISMETGAF